MTGTPINGSDLMVFLKGDSTDYISIAFATSHSLSLSTETVETSSNDTGGEWVAQAPRKLSWTTTTENLFSVEGEGKVFTDLFDLWTNRTEVELVFGLEKDYQTKADEVPEGGWTPVTTGQYKGKAIITSLEVNAPNGDNATFTATFTGVGALTKVATA